MGTLEDSSAYIDSVADAYLTEDGRRTGLQALDEVCRIHSTWNNRV